MRVYYIRRDIRLRLFLVFTFSKFHRKILPSGQHLYINPPSLRQFHWMLEHLSQPVIFPIPKCSKIEEREAWGQTVVNVLLCVQRVMSRHWRECCVSRVTRDREMTGAMSCSTGSTLAPLWLQSVSGRWADQVHSPADRQDEVLSHHLCDHLRPVSA